MSHSNESWLRRHPVLTLIAFNLVLFGIFAGIAEIALRVYIPYNPGFYVEIEGNSTEVVYPYGIIKRNSDGFPDDEFDMNKGRNVGYFGDSVTYGVGAGYPHRFSEHLAAAYPDWEHMNFGGIGLSVDDAIIERGVGLAKEFELDVAIYFFNLNDIVPDTIASGDEQTTMGGVRFGIVNYLDVLRGRSYLYSWLRTTAKNFLESRGVGFHGYAAFELYPERESETLRQTAVRINRFREAFAQIGVEFIFVALPYEMQISSEAAEKYTALGITWEDGFLEGSTQRIMFDYLDDDIRKIDLTGSFVDERDPEGSLARNGLGEYFVYNKGDKLDWNHPNRDGHKMIADYLVRVGVLDDLKTVEAAHAN